MVTEGAYAQLKRRWRVLLRKCVSKNEVICTVALACVVLHNIYLTRKDTCPKKLDLSLDPNSSEKRDRETVRELLQTRAYQKVNDTSTEASEIINALVEKYANK